MSKKIILIDSNTADNVAHERIIRRTFSDANISIIDNGQEALRSLSRELSDPDCQSKKVIIIDQKIPEMTGLEIIEQLEELVDLDPERVEIHFLTNDNSIRLVEKAKTVSAVKSIIRKPLTPESASQYLRSDDHSSEERDPNL